MYRQEKANTGSAGRKEQGNKSLTKTYRNGCKISKGVTKAFTERASRKVR